MSFEADVAIVGAGAAGLSAARLLARHRLRCVLLEASTCIGGRLRTLRRPGWELPIELGAEFVHGRPAPTLALAGGAIELVHVPERRVLVGPQIEPLHDTWLRLARALEGARRAPPQHSVADYLQQAKLPRELDELVRMIVEGYHAAPLEDVSARLIAEAAAQSADGFEQYRTARGYDHVVTSLEHGLAGDATRVRLGTRVTRVGWSRGRVTLETEGLDGNAQLSVKRCLVTVSLGVLQTRASEGGIAFDPEPASFRHALPGLAMGSVLRVVLRFEQQAPWVPAMDGGFEVSFVHVPGAPFNTLWRETRAGQVQITAWSAGPPVASLLQLEPPALIDAALQSLARATAVDVSSCKRALIEAHFHDFNRDPLTRGAYSYVRPGGEDAARRLAEPCDDTLFFAGEALDLQHTGTVAGALGSGEHAARRIIESWDN
jgi:monoamine oxidase